MSGIAKAAARNVTELGVVDDVVSGKTLKHMNEALIERLREGTTLISELKKGLFELENDKNKLQKKCEDYEKEIERLTKRQILVVE
jgi:septal ring factor EnvC (AmiA/AmiB activator)